MRKDKEDIKYNSLITVGIPFHYYTKASDLNSAIDSIYNQTLMPDEVHFIQDGPVKEEVQKVVNRFNKNVNIRTLIIPENKGLPYALNLSILNCSSKYYARMDSDDISHPERLKKQVAFLEYNSQIDILGTFALEFNDINDLNDESKLFLKKMPLTFDEIKYFFHYRNPFIHPSIVFRREVFATIGLYNINFSTHQDAELWARAIKFNIGMANLAEPLIYFCSSGIAKKRSARVAFRQLKARYSYNTFSPKLNLLKIACIGFRFLPYKIREWGYRKLR